MSVGWIGRCLRSVLIIGHMLAIARLVRSAVKGQFVRRTLASATSPYRRESVVLLIPVYNEQHRLAPCLEGAIRQPSSFVGLIVVADTGSTDRTRCVVAAYQARDPRVRWLEAGPPPPGWNGKAWGLYRACQCFDADWYLVVDADVRPAPTLAERLLHAARRLDADCASVALTQRLMPDRLSWLLHPAFLATLVYRYGIPGQVFTRSHDVLVNGQALLLSRAAVHTLDHLRAVAYARAEDVAMGRQLAQRGYRVAFLEPLDDSFVTMYRDGREVWHAWPRSLPAIDEQPKWRLGLDLLVVATTQGAWLPLLLFGFVQEHRSVRRLAFLAATLRWGMTIGLRRAYRPRRWWYWLSPLLDPLVVARLLQRTVLGTRTWRGRTIEGREHA